MCFAIKIWVCSGLVAVLTVGIALGQDSLTAVQQDIILGLKTYRFPEDQRRGFKLKNTLDDFKHPVIQQLLLDRFAQTQFDEAAAAAWEVDLQKSMQKKMNFINKDAEIKAWKLINKDTLSFQTVFDSLKANLINEISTDKEKFIDRDRIVPKIYLSYIVDLDLREAIPLLIEALKDEKHYPYQEAILLELARFQVEPYHTEVIKALSTDPVTGAPLCTEQGTRNVRSLCYIATQESCVAIANLVGCLEMIRRDFETEIMIQAGYKAVFWCYCIEDETFLKMRKTILDNYKYTTQAQLEEVKAWMIANQGKYIIKR